jgi:glycosyltransferase involved in cell wall biosynthesis
VKTYFYIAEINLPSKSAYTVHVMQMCNAIAKKNSHLNLLVPYIDPQKPFNTLKKEYGLTNNFKIKSVFKSKKKLNFFSRLIFAIICMFLIKKNKKKNYLIISRSIITSIINALFQIKNYLEIHTEIKGFTKIFFRLSSLSFVSKNLKFIFINKYLLNFFPKIKEDYLVLDDSVNFSLFKNDSKIKKQKNTCAYFGSLTKGKGIEIIEKVSRRLPEINFHIYGDLSISDFKNKKINKNNFHFFNYVKYYEIPKIMSKYEVMLMPYLNNVTVRSNNLDTAKYMSPLKLFEYLSMSKILIASDLKVYSHILKNNQNSILIKPHNINEWCLKIKSVFNNPKKFQYLKNRALITAKRYTWDKRVEKIFNHSRSR